MPTIAVNLGAVKDAYESLPLGKYLGEIEKATYKEAAEAGKFAQLQVQFLVIEGDLTGRKQSTWLSFSPKAAFMMKRFFNKFGLGDTPALDFDDDTNELLEPDITGYRVIFEVSQDRKDPTRIRTELVSVEDGLVAVATPVAATTVKRPTNVKAAPVEEATEPKVDAKAAAKAARIAAAQAALEAAAADDEDEETEETKEAEIAPRRAPVRPAPAARTAPTRRTLR